MSGTWKWIVSSFRDGFTIVDAVTLDRDKLNSEWVASEKALDIASVCERVCVCESECECVKASVADVHLTVLVVCGGEGGEAYWLALQRAQVHQAGRLGRDKLWNGH